MLKPGHVNPDLARYELHRVWVVEATLKAGTSHIYAKRVFYIDEDSWSIAVTDKYDTRSELWRVSEQQSINCYDIPMLYGTLEVHNDLQSAPLSRDGPAQRGAQGATRRSSATRRISRRPACAESALAERRA